MKIALLGYGKMGKRIDELATARGHEVILKIGSSSRATLTKEELAKADVVIEFTTPSTVVENINFCFEAGVPVVVGTTGWLANLKEISRKCIDEQGTLLHSSNFSIGVNVLFAMNKFLAACMRQFPEYEVSLYESHHTQKLDAPSGTAVTLANGINDVLSYKDKWVTLKNGDDQKLEGNEFPVFYDREDNVTGFHEISYRSEIDRIKISHEAFNRDGFALGSVLAAEFVKDKKGIYTTEDLFKFDSGF